MDNSIILASLRVADTNISLLETRLIEAEEALQAAKREILQLIEFFDN